MIHPAATLTSQKFFSENLALWYKSFSENFFLFFLFSFFHPVVHVKNADIAHLFAPQSLKLLFAYNWSSVVILIAYSENMGVFACCVRMCAYITVLVEN